MDCNKKKMYIKYAKHNPRKLKDITEIELMREKKYNEIYHLLINNFLKISYLLISIIMIIIPLKDVS
jgi:hypothetical protein